MPDIAHLSGTVATAAAYPVSAAPAERGRRFASVEPIVRVKAVGARSPDRRAAVLASEREGKVGAARPRADGHRVAPVAVGGGAFSLPSSQFLAQYIAQALSFDDADVERHGAGHTAYEAAAGQNVTYLGLQAPIDVIV